MSGINGVGGFQYVPETMPTAPAAGPQEATSSEADPLQAIQNLIKQLELSANTKAIPAHQNW